MCRSMPAAQCHPAQRTYLADCRWLRGSVSTFNITCRYTHNKHVVSDQTCSCPHNNIRYGPSSMIVNAGEGTQHNYNQSSGSNNQQYIVFNPALQRLKTMEWARTEADE
jgi:hypothetical protein